MKTESDLERLGDLLTEFGVGYRVEKGSGGDSFSNYDIRIICEEGGKKVGGYSGFLCDFRFDADGKFIGMGVWE